MHMLFLSSNKVRCGFVSHYFLDSMMARFKTLAVYYVTGLLGVLLVMALFLTWTFKLLSSAAGASSDFLLSALATTFRSTWLKKPSEKSSQDSPGPRTLP